MSLRPGTRAPRQAPRDGWRHEWADADGNASLQLARLPVANGNGVRFVLRAPHLCDFAIDANEGTVLVHPHDALDPHTLEHLLIDQVLPRLLAGRGHLIVHASQVRIGSGCVLFLGSSGWGKSTLAGLMHQNGNAAMCDDCVLLESREGRLLATASYPGLRLFQDSIDQAPTLARQLSPVSDYSDKQRVIGLDQPPGTHEPHRVEAIYVLSNPALVDGAFDIRPMPSANACMALVEHSFRLDPTDREQTVQLLAQAGKAVAASPVFALRFPHDFARQAELIDMLLDHLTTVQDRIR